MSLLSEQLSSFEYYKNKLPLFLQNSYGFLDQFRIWHDFLIGIKENNTGLLTSSDKILQLLDIFNASYISNLNSLEASNFGKSSEILDYLANLFGLNRSFTVSYYENSSLVNKLLILTNEELLLLIRATIIKQWFNGTYQQLFEQYLSIDLIIFQTNGATSGLSDVYLLTTDEQSYSNNVISMFLAGMLTIHSMGIIYSYSVLRLLNWLIWDNVNMLWGEASWA